MLKTFAIALCAMTLAACGGGGDDGPAGDPPLVQATTTHAKPDSGDRTNDLTLAAQSPASVATVQGQYRVRACVRGTWRQTLRAPATLRLTLTVYGQQVQTVGNIAGVAGAENRVTFSGCAETFSNSPAPTNVVGQAAVAVTEMDNRSAMALNGYDATIEWTVTRVQ